MSRRGFSLLEALFTMLLIGVALGLLAGVLRSYSRLSGYLDSEAPSTKALMAVSHTLRSELLQAVDVATPASLTTAEQLEFSKVDPNRLDRLTMTVADWTPYDLTDSAAQQDFLVRVLYQVHNGELTRAVKYPAESAYLPASLVTTSVSRFQCQSFPNDVLELRLTVEESRGPQVYSSRILRRVR